MEKRPYFKNSIDELEKIFETSKGDIKILEMLHYELEFRKTNRAKQLHAKVDGLINGREDNTNSNKGQTKVYSVRENTIDFTSQAKVVLETKETLIKEEREPIYAQVAAVGEEVIKSELDAHFETNKEN